MGFALSTVVITYIGVLFNIALEYSDKCVNTLKNNHLQALVRLFFAVVFMLANFNGISTYLEFGSKSISQNSINFSAIRRTLLLALFFIHSACVLFAGLNKDV